MPSSGFGSVALDYFHKNIERNIIVVIKIFGSAF